MEADEFTNQLKYISTKYKSWWYEPFEKFQANYQRKHWGIRNLKDYWQAVKDFETDLRKQYDFLADIFRFLDLYYEVYLNSTDQERIEIRSVVANGYFVDRQGYTTHFFEELLMRYVEDGAIKNLNSTGDRIWLLRGLVAMSMENCGSDFRDSLTCLADLYVEAERKGLDPQPDFENTARISSPEKPRGGPTSMQEIMANIGQYAIVKERRAIKTNQSKN